MTWMRAYDADALAGTARTLLGRVGWTTSTTWASSSAGRRQERPSWARADPAGKKVFDKQAPDSESKLRAVFDKLAVKFGTVLLIVDRPASIGALPLTVARDAGCKAACLPGLSVRGSPISTRARRRPTRRMPR